LYSLRSDAILRRYHIPSGLWKNCGTFYFPVENHFVLGAQRWQPLCLEEPFLPADKFSRSYCPNDCCAATWNCSASAKYLICRKTRMWIWWTIASDHNRQYDTGHIRFL
jgi:hypothetical protein